MRLICPNCGAQYEVADDVIPQAGRDVQCSNCGHTWFENPGASAIAEDEFADDTPLRAPEPETWEDDIEEDQDDAAPGHPAIARRQLDPNVADILREEAELEQAARRADMGQAIETQEEMPLAVNPRDEQHDKESRRRMAIMRGEDAPVSVTAAGNRRELLPDIEEINSTLRSSAERETMPMSGPTPAEVVTIERRGFRLGFFSMLLILALFALIYVLAPQISAAVPALTGPLDAYVALVDQGRLWLDSQMQGILKSLESSADS